MRRVLAVLLGAMFIVAACGSDSDESPRIDGDVGGGSAGQDAQDAAEDALKSQKPEG